MDMEDKSSADILWIRKEGVNFCHFVRTFLWAAPIETNKITLSFIRATGSRCFKQALQP